MTDEYFMIKDRCRQGLTKHLTQALSGLQTPDESKVLDIGCGTGVPTMFVAKSFNARITAIDTDKKSLDWLNRKIINQNLQNKITTINISFFELGPEHGPFDVILAEGFLNVVGFEKGFIKVIKILNQYGYFIIHDEFKDHDSKCDFIAACGCTLTGTIFLDEKVWWNDYYKNLLSEIESLSNEHTRDVFSSDLSEIELYRSDPGQFRSIYYIIRKN